MSARISASVPHTYQAHSNDTLLSEVVRVQIILLPRALLVAGYRNNGAVLIVRYNSYKEGQEWNAEFFEHEFINEPLLVMPQQVNAVFISSEHQMVVPDALFDTQNVQQWMRTIHAIHPGDRHLESKLVADKATYLLSLHGAVHKLLQRYFPQAKLLPVAAYQYYKPSLERAPVLQCLVTEDQVTATLRKEGKLVWHQVFAYQQVADIAWHFSNLCREQQMDPAAVQIEATAIADTCYDTLLELETFFPKVKLSNRPVTEETAWSPVLYLLQQLYPCAL